MEVDWKVSLPPNVALPSWLLRPGAYGAAGEVVSGGSDVGGAASIELAPTSSAAEAVKTCEWVS